MSLIPIHIFLSVFDAKFASADLPDDFGDAMLERLDEMFADAA